MADKKIHDFAVLWYERFTDDNSTERELCEDGSFGDACSSFGFKMDFGKSFEAAYPDKRVFNDWVALAEIINDMNDVDFLGTAVFSKWRYFNHWAMYESIADVENRKWFIIALSRLAWLTDDSPAVKTEPKIKDRVDGVEIDYHRIKRINYGVASEESEKKPLIWDYKEKITIDRETESLEYIRDNGDSCFVRQTYNVKGKVSSLLDALDSWEMFSAIEGNSPDVITDPTESRAYKITVKFRSGEDRSIEGSFDKNGLPVDFSYIAFVISKFMRGYGMSDILDREVYGRVLRKTTDLIFCNVEFNGFGKTYCYLTDDETISEDDYVIVPAGKDNRETIVRVESVEYHSEDDAPYPLDKIKRVIRKCTEDEVLKLYEDEEDDFIPL